MRRGVFPNPPASGRPYHLSLSYLGNAAARETFVTVTLPFAAAWTELFQNMIANSRELRWRENGPGIGRDARLAYSSLLGRYMARAYLTGNEGVRVLVPLDKAKRWLQGTPYSIEKRPPGHGLEADWIGLDDHRLIIAEAKGSFDKGVSTWRGPNSLPQVLWTAMEQARRTAVFRNPVSARLPVKCWAVASRWANEDNKLYPTLLAWDTEEEELDEDDYQVLAKLLHRIDVEGVLNGLGHTEAVGTLNIRAPSRRVPGDLWRRVPGDLWLRVGDRPVDPGFAAVLGPIGSHPLRGRNDLDQVRLIRELTPNVTLASLSSRYAGTIMRDPHGFDATESAVAYETARDGDDRFAQQAGLTIAWPTPDEDIAFMDD